MIKSQYGKIESPKLEEVLVSTLRNTCHSKYVKKTDGSIEILWIELRGRNKNRSFLTGVAYQPTSNETEKLIWL